MEYVHCVQKYLYATLTTGLLFTHLSQITGNFTTRLGRRRIETLVTHFILAALVFGISDAAYGGETSSIENRREDIQRTLVGKRLGPLPLYEGDIPNAKPGPDTEIRSQWMDMEILSRVSRPTYTVFLAPTSRASGAAALVFPGGGYQTLTWEMEGQWIARELQDQGVSAIVVNYRLPSEETMVDKAIRPLQDAQQAMRQVRRHAAEWGIDPRRIGAIGFSAGGHLASMLGTQFEPALVANPDHVSLRPDFLILVYPVISFAQGRVHPDMRRALIGDKPSPNIVQKFSSELHVSAQTPSTLLIGSSNDSAVHFDHLLDFYRALREHNVPAQLVLFDRGEHGFFQLRRGEWLDPMWAWMRRNGYLYCQ
jgi:acetyl esterase/lipase